MLDDITRDFEEDAVRDRLLHGLTEGSRARWPTCRRRSRCSTLPTSTARCASVPAVVRDEVTAMSERVCGADEPRVQGLKTRWPLEDMLGADLVAAAVRRIEAHCGRAGRAADEVDPTLWLRVDSFSLLQALATWRGGWSTSTTSA